MNDDLIPPDEILFVYNCEGTLFGLLINWINKFISPEKCESKLNQLTYGYFSMRSTWKDFIKSRPYNVNFLYREKWHELSPDDKSELPTVFKKNLHDLWEPIISAEEINGAESIKDLIELLESRGL